MRGLVSILLYGFLIDAIASAIGEWTPLSAMDGVINGTMLVLTAVAYGIAAFNTRLPVRFVLPIAGFLAWARIGGGFPLAFVFPDHHRAVLDLLQLALAAALLIARRNGRRPPPLDPRFFSWRRLALLASLAIVLLPFALAGGAIHALGTYLEARSDGYFKLRPAGVLLEEREFAKNGKTVRLVSMMHIGEKSFYDGVQNSLPGKEPAIVLLEGITDETGLLKRHFSYERLAEFLGLTSQENTSLQKAIPPAGTRPSRPSGDKPRIEYRHADIDVTALSPLTISFINTLGLILSSPTLGGALAAIGDPNTPLHQPGADELVFNDILDKRNGHLIAEIDRALNTSNIVVVPWGALHLPAIESALKERGFTEARRVDRPVVRFWSAAPAPNGE